MNMLNLLKWLFENLEVIYFLINIFCPVVTIISMFLIAHLFGDKLSKENKKSIEDLIINQKIFKLLLEYNKLKSLEDKMLRDHFDIEFKANLGIHRYSPEINTKGLTNDDIFLMDLKLKNSSKYNKQARKIENELEKLGVSMKVTYKGMDAIEHINKEAITLPSGKRIL